MTRKNMLDLRNLLYKMTLIGFIIYFVGLIFCAMFPIFLEDYSRLLFGTGNIAYAKLLLMGIFETLIIVFFLVPALALHWHCYKEDKKEKKPISSRKK